MSDKQTRDAQALAAQQEQITQANMEITNAALKELEQQRDSANARATAHAVDKASLNLALRKAQERIQVLEQGFSASQTTIEALRKELEELRGLPPIPDAGATGTGG